MQQQTCRGDNIGLTWTNVIGGVVRYSVVSAIALFASFSRDPGMLQDPKFYVISAVHENFLAASAQNFLTASAHGCCACSFTQDRRRLAAVLRSFLKYTAVLKYMDIRRGAAVRCNFKEAAVYGTDQEVTGGPQAGRQSKESSKAGSKEVSCVFPPSKTTESGHDTSSSERDSRESETRGFEKSFCPSGSTVSQAERPCRAANNSFIDPRVR